MCFKHILFIYKINLLFFKLTFNIGKDAVGFFLLLNYFLGNCFQKIFCVFPSKNFSSRLLRLSNSLHRSIAYLKKLIQIIREYSDESQSFQQGNFRIRCFLKHPGIEIQPTYFSIYIKFILHHITLIFPLANLKYTFHQKHLTSGTE